MIAQVNVGDTTAKIISPRPQNLKSAIKVYVVRRISSYRTGICREMDQLYAGAVNVFGKYATRWSRLPGLLRHERHFIELRKAEDIQLSWPTT